MSLPADAVPLTNLTLADPLICSVKEVFTSMLSTDVVIATPYFKKNPHATHLISGVVDFFGKTNGSVVVSFADKGVDELIEAFSGSPPGRQTTAFRDAIGELANMIAGSAKGRLGGVATISTPRVIVGRQLMIEAGTTNRSLVIPCQSSFCDFTVELYILRIQAAA